jgi:ubiquitin conjugation factor E4 B
MQLMRYVIAWLLRLVQPESEYPKRQINLPLATEQPLVFRCLPEYFLEDIVDNFKFVTQHIPQVIPVTQCEELVTVCVTFLRSIDYVKNPYLKSGLVSILFHGVWPVKNRPKGILGDLLNGSEFCHKHLLHALMQFYIEAESTGGHNQFYDKFNIRYEIFQVIRCIWSNPVYRENLDTESKVNPDFFVRFVNLLLNDVTYVLGESFRAFNKIHDIQGVLEDPNNGLDDAQKQENQENLEEQQRMAKANMQLTNETVSMLKLFTEALAEAFTTPEIVQRLADMLDYNMEALVGPKQINLKVSDPEQYQFNPASLLADIMSVYLNLKNQPSFHLAVARDGRSYKEYNFNKAGEIVGKKFLKSPEELKQWKKLGATIEKVKKLEEQAEEDLGDIPDEFLDPLLFTLMEDPVKLPVSGVYIDRSSIRTHLLSDPQDPFNRVPLKIEEVIPATDLKERIEKFKADAKMRKLEAMAAEVADDDVAQEDKMDVTP